MTDRREQLRARFAARRAKLELENARVTARAGRNLVFAVGTGLAFGAVFVISLFVWPPLLYGLAAVLAVAGTIELSSAMRQAGLRVPRFAVAISAVVILAGATFFGAEGLVLTLLAAGMFLTVWRLIEVLIPRFHAPLRGLVIDVFAGLFALAYVPFPLGMALLVRAHDNGQWWIFALIIVVVSVDIGAYAAGVTLGKHKMAPRVSPNKTWEGFGGAALAATVAATLCAVFMMRVDWWIGPIYGLVILVTATVGDLTESLIKRNLGIKDMSSWLPGHGGLLDRIDSILPSIVVMYGFALAFHAVSPKGVLFP